MAALASWLLVFGVAGSGYGAGLRVVRLVVHPASLELRGAQAGHGLIVSAVTRDGREIDVTAQSTFASKQPAVVAVSTNGTCRALANGTAEVVVQFGGKARKVSVTAIETEVPRQISFRQDVEPVMTRAGCNQGACHGKLAGQNGFKLSLRGYAPELDYAWLITDLSGRRINPAFPADSLLVQNRWASCCTRGAFVSRKARVTTRR